MEKMTSFGTMVARTFGSVLAPQGFVPKGKMMFVRVSDNLLQYVLVEQNKGRFTVVVSIQPLFVPFGDYAVAFGGRLGRILSGYDHWYPDQPEEQAQASLNLVAGQLETHALPWMNQRSTVENLVEAYKGVNAFSRYELSHGLDAYVFIWTAYCKAYLGQNEDALALLREHLGPANKNPWPWYESARTLLSVLQEQQEGASTLLSQWASDSKVRLGLTVS